VGSVFAQRLHRRVVPRGKKSVAHPTRLRPVSDFEYEFQMAGLNRNLAPELEAKFLTPPEQYTFISSSIIKAIAQLSGDISSFVPDVVHQQLIKKFKQA
jgi:pantetheine-phosphate adenylyltransferase